MKKILRVTLFSTLVAGVLTSCSDKKIACFNSTIPDYHAKVKKKNTSKKEEQAIVQIKNSVKEPAYTSQKTVAEESYYIEAETNATPKKIEPAYSIELKEEPKMTKREVKKAIKKQIKSTLKTDEERTGLMNVLLVIFAIILPPLAVLFTDGLRGPFWLSILLTLLFYLPGLIYALWRIFKERP